MKKARFKITAMVGASLLTAMLGIAHAAPLAVSCGVIVCNKLERFTLSPWSAIKDRIGEQCAPALLSKSDAVTGKVLDSTTRFYQGGFNPTKKSVTRVKEVNQCSE